MRRNTIVKINTNELAGFKIICVGILFSVVLFCLWARACWIQIIKGSQLARLAQNQYWCQEKIQGRRGKIFDRNGLVLAQSVLCNSVYANPLEIDDYKQTARKLARILKISRAKLIRMLRQKKSFVWLARKISDRKASLINRINLKGIHLIKEYKRIYPQGHLLGQALGFVGIDGYGLEGLEKFFDDYLRGSEKKFMLLKDALGRKIAPDTAGDILELLSGDDLYLTIDARVQLTAEEALAAVVEKYSGRSGVCVVVHVPTGEILALANYPYFNPNDFRHSKPGIWRNRAVLDLFEPGSTVKPFLVAAALSRGVCNRDSIYFCENGCWQLGTSKINDTHKHGWLPVNKIIRYSSNIGAAKIGLDLGAEAYFEFLQNLGFTRAIMLPFPGRVKGLIRPYHRWNKGDLAAASFGQGFAITTMHLVQAYLCLAREGVLAPLKLISKLDQTRINKKFQMDEHERRIFSARVAQSVLSMLREVVEEDGTGKRARIPGVEVGGKTGTAQKAVKTGTYGDKYVASFVALLPALKPRYLVVVVVDEPHPHHGGGIVAAPAAKRVGMELLSLYCDYPGVQSVKYDEQSRQTISASKGKEGDVTFEHSFIKVEGPVPDLQGISLRKAVKLLLSMGIVPEVIGQGMVVRKQDPVPGTKWSEDRHIRLWIGF